MSKLEGCGRGAWQERLEPAELLREMARQGERFYR